MALGDFNVDPAHARWFDQPPLDRDRERRRVQHADVIRRWHDEWASGASLTFALRLAKDGIAIGEADLQPRPPVTANFAYTVTPDHRGMGYAPRAARLLAEAGLTGFGFHRIELVCDVGNATSRRVAEKAGFVAEGVRRRSGWFENVPEFGGVPRDEAVYSLIRSEYPSSPIPGRPDGDALVR